MIGERWPKSAAEVVITVLEGEEDGFMGASGGWGMMSVLAGCITVASAALVDAGIDCVDLVSGGVAAISEDLKGILLDPSPSEHDLKAACVVAYLQSRDEITEMWMKGDAGMKTENLIDSAVRAACMTRTVLAEAIKEAVEVKTARVANEDGAAEKGEKSVNGEMKGGKGKEVIMTG